MRWATSFSKPKRTQTIDATVAAAAVAVGGGAVAIEGAGAGASTRNQVRTLVKAFIGGTGTTSVVADSISLTADDNSTITAFTGSASLAGAVGAVGGSISVAVGVAKNEISNEIDAYVINAGTLEATGTDGIEIKAIDAATIKSTATAASAAASFGVLYSFSGAGGGAEAVNVILTKTRAYADSSDLTSAGKIDVSCQRHLDHRCAGHGRGPFCQRRRYRRRHGDRRSDGTQLHRLQG